MVAGVAAFALLHASDLERKQNVRPRRTGLPAVAQFACKAPSTAQRAVLDVRDRLVHQVEASVEYGAVLFDVHQVLQRVGQVFAALDKVFRLEHHVDQPQVAGLLAAVDVLLKLQQLMPQLMQVL